MRGDAMRPLEGFFYLSAGLAATVFPAERVAQAFNHLKAQHYQALRKAFDAKIDDILESVRPTVELWWEDRGKHEIDSHEDLLPDGMPENVKRLFWQDHAEKIKEAAVFLAVGLVASQSPDMYPAEMAAIIARLEESRATLLAHGVEVSNFEKLFV